MCHIVLWLIDTVSSQKSCVIGTCDQPGWLAEKCLILLSLLQGVASQISLDWTSIQLAYFQADGIPRELRLWQGRLAMPPSQTTPQEQQIVLESGSALRNQSQQALA